MKLFAALGAAILCLLAIRRHKPVRQIVGGFRYETCGRAGDSFDDFDAVGTGYVRPLRPTYRRDGRGGLMRDEWMR